MPTHEEIEKMPYNTIQDLPKPVASVLPKKAQAMFMDAFNKAYYEYGWPESRCFQYAWGTVKKVYTKNKNTGKWTKK